MVVMTSDLRYTIEEKTSAINEQLARPEDGMPKVSLSVGVAFADRRIRAKACSRTPIRRCITRRNTAATAARSTATKGTGAGADTQG